MISIYQTQNHQLSLLQALETGCWVNITNPTESDQLWLQEHLPIVTDEYLREATDTDEVSRVEQEDDFLMIVVRIPHFQGVDSDKPFTVLPIMFIISDTVFISICKEENAILQEFIKERVKGFHTAKKYKFLLQFMFQTASKFLLHLRKINKNVDDIEDQLAKSLKNEDLMELLRYEKTLIYYITALRSNEAMMRRLDHMRIFRLYEEDEYLLEDVIIENTQALEMTKTSQNIIKQIADAYFSIINNNVNSVVKLLTLVTICISIPTLVASFYGMNIPLPAQNSPNSVLYFLLISLALIFVAVWFFRKRGWF